AVVDDVPFSGARITRHDREHQVLCLFRAIVLAEVQLGVVALTGKDAELPAEVAAIPIGERGWIAREQEHAADHQRSSHLPGLTARDTSETDGTVRRAMRLVVARCEILYTGRLTARLPKAVRLLMFKADGSFLVH